MRVAARLLGAPGNPVHVLWQVVVKFIDGHRSLTTSADRPCWGSSSPSFAGTGSCRRSSPVPSAEPAAASLAAELVIFFPLWVAEVALLCWVCEANGDG